MILEDDIRNLTGKILLSTSSIGNDYLAKSMVYVCGHDKTGAIGVAVNKLIPNFSILSILEALHLKTDDMNDVNIHFGGPCEAGKCFTIHSDDYQASTSTRINNNISLTVDPDIIHALTSKRGPSKKILCIGCFLWEAEQLELEVASSYWIAINSDEALIFGNPLIDKWSKALLKIGSQTTLLSSAHGTA